MGDQLSKKASSSSSLADIRRNQVCCENPELDSDLNVYSVYARGRSRISIEKQHSFTNDGNNGQICNNLEMWNATDVNAKSVPKACFYSAALDSVN